MAGVCMFMLKEGSRNAFNNDRKDPVFRANYQSVFGLDLPHLDTVDDYFRDLATSCLEEVKASLIRDLLRMQNSDDSGHSYRFIPDSATDLFRTPLPFYSGQRYRIIPDSKSV